MGGTLQALRFACHALLRSRGYAFAAVITFALGLAVNIEIAGWVVGPAAAAAGR